MTISKFEFLNSKQYLSSNFSNFNKLFGTLVINIWSLFRDSRLEFGALSNRTERVNAS